MYKDHFDATENAAIKRACFCTEPSIAKTFRNVLSEILGTFVLVACVFYFAQAEINDGKGTTVAPRLHRCDPPSPLWSEHRSLAVHALLPIKGKTDSDWGYAWISAVGPIIGALFAAGLFLLLG